MSMVSEFLRNEGLARMECARVAEVEPLETLEGQRFLSAVHSPHAGASVNPLPRCRKGFACAGERMHGLQLWVKPGEARQVRNRRYQENPKLVNS